MKYLMAIDAGTGSVRAVIFDTLGNQIAISQKVWEHLSEEGVPNSMGFDFEKNWSLTLDCIENVIKQSKIDPTNIVAISSSSMREGIVVYDKDNNELWGVANVDARASKEVQELKSKYEGIEKEFYSKSGQTLALGAIPRLLWLKKYKKDIYDKVASISMISDWILFKLSGVISVEPSNASTTGILNLKSRDWQNDFAKKVGLKDNIFPKVYETGETIGLISKNIAQKLNLSYLVKIVSGGGDVQIGSLGLGIISKGEVAILGGSFWQQIVNIPLETQLPEDMNIRVNSHVLQNLSQAEGITFFSGLVMRWFVDAFCDIEKLEAKEQGRDVYSILEVKASKVPVGSYDITPIFSDSMNYAKWYHAAPSFINLSIDSSICNKASMFRSLEENAAIVSYINLQKVQKFTNIEFDTIVFASGASKGELWCQILSDVTGKYIKVPVVKEATSLGCAIAAGVGAGIYSSLEDGAKALVKWDKTYSPNMDNHILYQEITKRWEKIYKSQLDLVDQNLTTSMWKAPGL